MDKKCGINDWSKAHSMLLDSIRNLIDISPKTGTPSDKVVTCGPSGIIEVIHQLADIPKRPDSVCYCRARIFVLDLSKSMLF